MDIAKLIRKHLPNYIVSPLWGARQSFMLWKDALHQIRRFEKYYSRILPNNKEQLETRIIFLTHQIEKGLSHQQFRKGFGKSIFCQLPELLSRLENADEDYRSNFYYMNCISALHEYVKRHRESSYNLDWQESCFEDRQWEQILNTDLNTAGIIEVRKSDKTDNETKSFIELCKSRHSIREFSEEPITKRQLMRAIQMAMVTPSVCNRQPTRVYVILDPVIIAEALKIQGGVNGYPSPPGLLMLTADCRMFMTASERNEGYVDGGLFSMSLLLALETSGIGACPLNAMFTHRAEMQTRELLHLPDWEVPVMYIEVGHFPEIIPTCKSARLGANLITTVVQ